MSVHWERGWQSNVIELNVASLKLRLNYHYTRDWVEGTDGWRFQNPDPASERACSLRTVIVFGITGKIVIKS